jgi:endoglucanase
MRRASWAPIWVALSLACAKTPPEEGAGPIGPIGPVTPWDSSRSGKGFPFGSHPAKYAPGVILPRGDQATLDAAVRSKYDSWKTAYVTAACGGYYVSTGGGTGADAAVTVSEGHGYGMLATAIMAGHDPQARDVFDGFYRVFRMFPSQNDRQLMAWAIGAGCKPTSGSDSATDGDLDIAFALLLADRQWGSTGAVNYLAEAKKLVAAINKSEMNSTTRLPLLGDWADDASYAGSTRPSDFMVDHFRSFASVSGSTSWLATVERIYSLVASMQSRFSPAAGLLPDFVIGTGTSPSPPMGKFLEGDTDDDYAYNSCRVPWRLGTDFVLTGDPRARSALNTINVWIKVRTGGDPKMVLDGYKLDGGPLGDSATAAFVAPFGVAAMTDASHQDWLDAVWKWLVDTGREGYYSDSIRLLSMIVMSGNWWEP